MGEVEVFVPVPVAGFEDFYEISNHGTIRGLDRRVVRTRSGKTHLLTCEGRVLKPGGDTVGYFVITLSNGGERYASSIHRLVAKAFVPAPEGVEFSDLQVNHIDGDKKNNKASNLEWVTQQDNIKHANANGLKPTFSGGFKGADPTLSIDQIKKVKKLLSKGKKVHEVAEIFSVKPVLIAKISQGRSWKNV